MSLFRCPLRISALFAVKTKVHRKERQVRRKAREGTPVIFKLDEYHGVVSGGHSREAMQQFQKSKRDNLSFRGVDNRKMSDQMSENEGAPTSDAADKTAEIPAEAQPAVAAEDISYHAVEKDGVVTAIWEMNGRKHVRTIDPRSRQGEDILRLYTTEHHDEVPAAEASDAASS